MKKNQEKRIGLKQLETLDQKDLREIVGGPIDGEATGGGSGG